MKKSATNIKRQICPLAFVSLALSVQLNISFAIQDSITSQNNTDTTSYPNDTNDAKSNDTQKNKNCKQKIWAK